MWVQEHIENIVKHLDCEYSYSEQYSRSFRGARHVIATHAILLKHRSADIKLVYEFGNHDIAEVQSSFKTSRLVHDFKVTTKSQLKRLFSVDKDPFNIKCDSPQFKQFLKRTLESTGYKKFALDTSFEPEITGSVDSGVLTLECRFYLGFENKEYSIIPSIELHKSIIDKVLNY